MSSRGERAPHPRTRGAGRGSHCRLGARGRAPGGAAEARTRLSGVAPGALFQCRERVVRRRRRPPRTSGRQHRADASPLPAAAAHSSSARTPRGRAAGSWVSLTSTSSSTGSRAGSTPAQTAQVASQVATGDARTHCRRELAPALQRGRRRRRFGGPAADHSANPARALRAMEAAPGSARRPPEDGRSSARVRQPGSISLSRASAAAPMTSSHIAYSSDAAELLLDLNRPTPGTRLDRWSRSCCSPSAAAHRYSRPRSPAPASAAQRRQRCARQIRRARCSGNAMRVPRSQRRRHDRGATRPALRSPES